MVAELEERNAALAEGYSFAEYQALPRDERILTVAHYRLSRLLRMHEQDALERERKWRETIARNQGQV